MPQATFNSVYDGYVTDAYSCDDISDFFSRDTTATSFQIGKTQPAPYNASSRYRSFLDFNISGIPGGSTITKIEIGLRCSQADINMYLNQLATPASGYFDDALLFGDIGAGARYLTVLPTVSGITYYDLGSGAITDFNSHPTLFSLGIDADLSTFNFTTPAPLLDIFYSNESTSKPVLRITYSSITNVTVNPSALNITSTARTPSKNVTISPGALNISSSIKNPTVTATANVTINPNTLNIVSSVQTPSKNTTINPASLNITSTVQSPAINLDVTISPNSLNITSTPQVPVVSTTSDVTINVSALNITSSALPAQVILTNPVQTGPLAPQGATGSGVRTKKRRSYRLYQEWNVDGIKGFNKEKVIEVLAKLINLDVKQLKVNGSITHILTFDVSTVGQVNRLIEKSYIANGILQSLNSASYSILAVNKFISQKELLVTGQRTTKQVCDFSVCSKKEFTETLEYSLHGKLQVSVNLNTIVTGKRDILPILVALDLYNEENIK